MSDLITNLQSIYNTKLQIKQALETESDVFADYPTYISDLKPEGYTYITSNGDFNVSAYENVSVLVDGSTEYENTTITANGDYNISTYGFAYVSVPVPAGYIQPSGTYTATANGTHDISSYSNVDVEVPVPQYVFGYQDITTNGTTYASTYGLDGFTYVNVDVPVPAGYLVPSGTYTASSNGTHDISTYANVSVNVPVSSGGHSGDTFEDAWCCNEAITYIVNSGSTAVTENKYVKGFVRQIEYTFTSTYPTCRIYISDNQEGTGALLYLRNMISEDVYLKRIAQDDPSLGWDSNTDKQIQVGDFVVAWCGQYVYYENTQAQMSQGTLVSHKKAENSGQLSVSQSGTYDVQNYVSAYVNVSGGGSGETQSFAGEYMMSSNGLYYIYNAGDGTFGSEYTIGLMEPVPNVKLDTWVEGTIGYFTNSNGFNVYYGQPTISYSYSLGNSFSSKTVTFGYNAAIYETMNNTVNVYGSSVYSSYNYIEKDAEGSEEYSTIFNAPKSLYNSSYDYNHGTVTFTYNELNQVVDIQSFTPGYITAAYWGITTASTSTEPSTWVPFTYSEGTTYVARFGHDRVDNDNGNGAKAEIKIIDNQGNTQYFDNTTWTYYNQTTRRYEPLSGDKWVNTLNNVFLDTKTIYVDAEIDYSDFSYSVDFNHKYFRFTEYEWDENNSNFVSTGNTYYTSENWICKTTLNEITDGYWDIEYGCPGNWYHCNYTAMNDGETLTRNSSYHNCYVFNNINRYMYDINYIFASPILNTSMTQDICYLHVNDNSYLQFNISSFDNVNNCISFNCSQYTIPTIKVIDGNGTQIGSVLADGEFHEVEFASAGTVVIKDPNWMEYKPSADTTLDSYLDTGNSINLQEWNSNTLSISNPGTYNIKCTVNGDEDMIYSINLYIESIQTPNKLGLNFYDSGSKSTEWLNFDSTTNRYQSSLIDGIENEYIMTISEYDNNDIEIIEYKSPVQNDGNNYCPNTTGVNMILDSTGSYYIKSNLGNKFIVNAYYEGTQLIMYITYWPTAVLTDGTNIYGYINDSTQGASRVDARPFNGSGYVGQVYIQLIENPFDTPLIYKLINNKNAGWADTEASNFESYSLNTLNNDATATGTFTLSNADNLYNFVTYYQLSSEGEMTLWVSNEKIHETEFRLVNVNNSSIEFSMTDSPVSITTDLDGDYQLVDNLGHAYKLWNEGGEAHDVTTTTQTFWFGNIHHDGYTSTPDTYMNISNSTNYNNLIILVYNFNRSDESVELCVYMN